MSATSPMPPSEVASPARPTPASAGRSAAKWLVVLGAIGGGVLGWWLVNRYESPFAPTAELQDLFARRMAMQILTDEQNARIAELEAQLAGKNAAFAIALVGASVAAATGLAAGLGSRSTAGAAAGLVSGAAAGAVLGGAGGWLGGFVYQMLKVRAAVDPSYATIAAHAVAWIAVGAAVAIAAGFGFRAGPRIGPAVGAALVGGSAAAAIYPVVAGLAFRMSNSDLVIPAGSWNRLAWITIAATATAVAAVRAGARGTARPSATSPAA